MDMLGLIFLIATTEIAVRYWDALVNYIPRSVDHSRFTQSELNRLLNPPRYTEIPGSVSLRPTANDPLGLKGYLAIMENDGSKFASHLNFSSNMVSLAIKNKILTRFKLTIIFRFDKQGDITQQHNVTVGVYKNRGWIVTPCHQFDKPTFDACFMEVYEDLSQRGLVSMNDSIDQINSHIENSVRQNSLYLSQRCLTIEANAKLVSEVSILLAVGVDQVEVATQLSSVTTMKIDGYPEVRSALNVVMADPAKIRVNV